LADLSENDAFRGIGLLQERRYISNVGELLEASSILSSVPHGAKNTLEENDSFLNTARNPVFFAFEIEVNRLRTASEREGRHAVVVEYWEMHAARQLPREQ
jgi:hypothetical protein